MKISHEFKVILSLARHQTLEYALDQTFLVSSGCKSGPTSPTSFSSRALKNP